jgi:excinuclease ABC subunit A
VTKEIVIKGAKAHNLKNLSLNLPKNSLIVFTGVSGSGKTSLAFDIIHVEAQRKFLETLSPKFRDHFNLLPSSTVEYVSGLNPSIGIEQKTLSKSNRQTVATLSEIDRFLKPLFVGYAEIFCVCCKQKLTRTSSHSIAQSLVSLEKGTKVQILAPISVSEIKSKKLNEILENLQKQGFSRVRFNNEIILIDEISLLENQCFALDVVIDRLIIKEGMFSRVIESIELAYRLFSQCVISISKNSEEQETYYTENAFCVGCNYVAPKLTEAMFSFNSKFGSCSKCFGIGEIKEKTCSKCLGQRFNSFIETAKISELNLLDIYRLTVECASSWFDSLQIKGELPLILVKEITKRLDSLAALGLGYLELYRSAASLSTGESKRIQIATQVNSDLSGVLYILDEPTQGLHQKDRAQLLDLIKKLKKEGNSVIVVEHDESFFAEADLVVELGSGAGELGGKIEFIGYGDKYLDYLSKTTLINDISKNTHEQYNKGTIKIIGARKNNIRGEDVEIPLNKLVCITGVSGAGKSSLLEIINLALDAKINSQSPKELFCQKIFGWEELNEVRMIDREFGRSSKSNPATYLKIFDLLRSLFAELPEARARGYQANRFSFNIKGGRCEACKGLGVVSYETDVLSDFKIVCDLCLGACYNQDTLEIKFKGYSIADFLDMTITQAHQLLLNFPEIQKRLAILIEVGLGYLKLGQRTETLSGGEAQRIKLSSELSKNNKGTSLYLFDEPTVGLSRKDITNLLRVFRKICDQGHSIIAIEHNSYFISQTDWTINLGPGAGESGGKVTYSGKSQG